MESRWDPHESRQYAGFADHRHVLRNNILSLTMVRRRVTELLNSTHLHRLVDTLRVDSAVTGFDLDRRIETVHSARLTFDLSGNRPIAEKAAV